MLARIERLNDAYARGEIELDELERRTAEVIKRGGETPAAPTRAAGTGAARSRPGWLLPCVVIAGVVIVIGAVASTSASTPVPDVVGMYPQEAIAEITAAGLRTNSHGGIGAEEGKGLRRLRSRARSRREARLRRHRGDLLAPRL